MRNENQIPSEATRPAPGPLAGGLRCCHHRDDEREGPDLHPTHSSEIPRSKPTVSKPFVLNSPQSNVRLNRREWWLMACPFWTTSWPHATLYLGYAPRQVVVQ